MNEPEPLKGDILIVDDVPENLWLLFNMLTEEGYEVRRVINGQQALKAAQTDPPDLILLDIKMPDINGYEVCKKLKTLKETASIPVIFLSALHDPFDKVKAFEVGGVDYISKPFQLQEVLARVENQFKLLKMQRQLEEKNRVLETLNQDLEAFSYTVSHDLRNPLTIINSCLWLLHDKYSQYLDQEGQRYFQLIDHSAQRMRQIIEALMRLCKVKKDGLCLETINLSALVEEIGDVFQKKQPQRPIKLIIQSKIMARGDPWLLKIALENLLDNALKFTAKKNTSKIEFGILSETASTSSHPVYFLRDNGVGFEGQKAAQLFTPFKRLHQQSEFEGNGIGLATVERIISLHGGKIWCESEVNQGTTFYFTLE